MLTSGFAYGASTFLESVTDYCQVVVKTCSFSYLSLSPDTETVFAVGSDRTVKQIRRSRIEQEIDLHSFQLSSVCLSGDGKVLVSGKDSNGICDLIKSDRLKS